MLFRGRAIRAVNRLLVDIPAGMSRSRPELCCDAREQGGKGPGGG